MSFRQWTVLPHDNIEKLSPQLWTVSGKMPKGNQRRMTVVRLSDGRLVVHNAVALDDTEMAELDQWGEVAALVVPNSFHRQDLFIWKNRYKNAQVYCPAGAAKAVAKIVDVDGDYSQIPGDSTLTAEHLDGMKNAEGVLSIKGDSGTTLVFNDAFLNMPSTGLFADLLMSPVGTLSIPRFARFMWLKDRKAFSSQMERFAKSELERIIVGHGQTVETDVAARFGEALNRLR